MNEKKENINGRDFLLFSETIKEKYRPDHFFLKNIAGWITLLATLLIDTSVLWDFVQANRIPIGFSLHGLGGFGVVAGFLLVLDILLPIVFVSLKRQYCRTEMTPKVLVVGSFTIVGIFILSMLAVRWSLVTPETIARGSKTYPQVIIFGLLPIGTSITSSLLFWLSYNPLLKKMCYLEMVVFSENEKLMNVQSELVKYDCDKGDFRSRLVEAEHSRYQQKFLEIKILDSKLKAYFRRRLAEFLANPRDATILSENEFLPQIESVEMMDVSNCMKQTTNNGGVEV